MSREDIYKLRALIYLYFDAIQHRVSTELDNKTNRILYSPYKMTYDEAVKILQLKDKLDILHTVEKELYELIDSFE